MSKVTKRAVNSHNPLPLPKHANNIYNNIKRAYFLLTQKSSTLPFFQQRVNERKQPPLEIRPKHMLQCYEQFL